LNKVRIGVGTVVVVCLTALGVRAEQVQLQASAREQIRVLRQEKRDRTPAQRKIQSKLLFSLYKSRKDTRLAALPSLRTKAPSKDGRMLVDVDLASSADFKTVLSALERAGGEITTASARYKTIRARLPLDKVEGVAALGGVRKVLLARPFLTHKVNTSEGDAAHRAAQARGAFGVDGTGQKVCVLSDGVSGLAASQASGDLPAVDVLPGQVGSGNEGTAMLEIVHDLAPGATLGFATAFGSEAGFAQNILDLAADDCTIIVDDIIYLDESPFQDGIVAQAVNSVTNAGVLYFSSAGNEGNKNDGTSGTWEGDFKASVAADPGPLAGANLHDFGDGGNTILVTASTDDNVLIWNDAYGESANDYDIYDMNAALTQIFDASTDVQDGDDDPVEYWTASFSGERILIDKFAGDTRVLNYISFRGQLDPALATGGATRGHSAAANAFSVAAVDATTGGGAGGAFDGSESVEEFSSDGPRRIFFDGDGDLLPGAPAGDFTATGGVVRQKPDIAAADGVSTAAGAIFNPFFGTSAAAPHAAAIAALVKQAFPAFTPAQVRTALTDSALDIEETGIDRDSGAGIVMAYETLSDNGAPFVASLVPDTILTTQATGDGDAFPEPNETFNLTVALKNVGGASATSVSAVLSTSTPGVTITQANSTYPTIASGASINNATPFAFNIGSAAECGIRIDFTLTVALSGGATPQMVEFSVTSGQPGAPVTFSYAGSPVAIPDSAGADIPGAPAVTSVTVAGLTRLQDLDFRIDGSSCSNVLNDPNAGITHSFAGDLVLDLESPGGTHVPLVSRLPNGGGGNSGNNFCQTLLDDEASVSIQAQASAAAPFTGSFTPASLLSAFDGETANGTWNLSVTDNFVGDLGTVRAYSLIATGAVCNAPVQATGHITVTAPNTAVTWQAGTTKAITFKHDLGKDKPVKIEVNRGGPSWLPNPANWQTIASPVLTTAAKTGTYNWVVSGVTGQARIRVTSIDQGATDINDVPFVISSRVKVTSPNTNVAWKVGSKHNITWTHNYPTPASFDIKLDNNNDGVCETAIQSGVVAAGATGSYNWTVAGSGTTNKVCVSKTPADPDGVDSSDVAFKITP
jgi:subtilisin-like proprotein convertase family protein